MDNEYINTGAVQTDPVATNDKDKTQVCDNRQGHDDRCRYHDPDHGDVALPCASTEGRSNWEK